jgi:hypothetical protein
MKCPNCEAFLSAYRAAAERYAAASDKLDEMKNIVLKDPAYFQQEAELLASHLDYRLAKDALRVHREGHEGH